MILTAKNEKFKVEIELERKNYTKNSRINFHQWMVLRINKIDFEEDEGIWKCQIFVNDERNKGRLKLEGESRKRIVSKFFWKILEFFHALTLIKKKLQTFFKGSRQHQDNTLQIKRISKKRETNTSKRFERRIVVFEAI